jgi:hypothetical protein
MQIIQATYNAYMYKSRVLAGSVKTMNSQKCKGMVRRISSLVLLEAVLMD